MSNRTNLINDIVFAAQESCRKSGIVASREVLQRSVEQSLGTNTVGDDEFIILGKTSVNEEVAINDSGSLCRTVTVNFSTREFRIATSNYMLLASSFYANENSEAKVGGFVHPYTGSIADLPKEKITVGDVSAFENDNVHAFYYGIESRMVSFEKQDVFVIVKRYSGGKLSRQRLDSAHNHSDSSNKDYYEGKSDRYPNWHSDFDAYWYYNTKPVKGWFGRIKDNERYGKALGAVIELRNKKREGYHYGIDCQITDDVALYLIDHSWSFNPRVLERLPSC